MEKFIQKIAEGAGSILLSGFHLDHKSESKTNMAWDVVTDFDRKSEEYLVKHIQKKFPLHGILGEEGGMIGNKKEYWIIDPLDGTWSYSKHIPLFSVLIAHVKQGKVLHSTIYDPIHKEFFYAAKGKGAFLNGKRISVSQKKELKHSLGSGYMHPEVYPVDYRKKVNARIAENEIVLFKIIGTGISSAYVAAGRTDFFYGCGENTVWDYAAPWLVLTEAGCKVTDIEGKPFNLSKRQFVCANSVLHKQIVAMLKN